MLVRSEGTDMPKPQATYRVEMTEQQLRVVQAAMDLYSRLGMGQLEEIFAHPDLRKRRAELPQVMASTERDSLSDAMGVLKSVVFPELVADQHYGIRAKQISDDNRIACDVSQVIRHRLAWDGAGNPPQRRWPAMAQVDFDPPPGWSAVPLPRIEACPAAPENDEAAPARAARR